MFETTVFSTWDLPDIKNSTLRKWIIDPYVRWAKGVVRTETDVIMITHLLTYLCTSVPSALHLFYDFRWWHGVLHSAVQLYYMGPYTLLMHQHIHMKPLYPGEWSSLVGKLRNGSVEWLKVATSGSSQP